MMAMKSQRYCDIFFTDRVSLRLLTPFGNLVSRKVVRELLCNFQVLATPAIFNRAAAALAAPIVHLVTIRAASGVTVRVALPNDCLALRAHYALTAASTAAWNAGSDAMLACLTSFNGVCRTQAVASDSNVTGTP